MYPRDADRYLVDSPSDNHSNLLMMLQVVCAQELPITVEAAGQILSKLRETYTSEQDALGELEQLRMLGWITYCAPSADSWSSTWPHFRPTEQGKLALEEKDAFSHAAWRLWVGSDCD